MPAIFLTDVDQFARLVTTDRTGCRWPGSSIKTAVPRAPLDVLDHRGNQADRIGDAVRPAGIFAANENPPP